MSVTTQGEAKVQPTFNAFHLAVIVLILLAALVGLIVVTVRAGEESRESAAQAMIAEVTEELNVEVVDYNAHGPTLTRFIDIRNNDGDTFHCDYPFEFDGELHNCTPITTIGANGNPVK